MRRRAAGPVRADQQLRLEAQAALLQRPRTGVTPEQQVERCTVALPRQIVRGEQALAGALEQAGDLFVRLGVSWGE